MSRRSVSRYFIQLGSSPISWKTKKQDTISHSFAEVEYRVMVNAASEVVWLRNLMASLGFTVPPALMHCDNQAALHIAANHVFHEHIKHIEVDCHFV